jgi:hypothetical protein
MAKLKLAMRHVYSRLPFFLSTWVSHVADASEEVASTATASLENFSSLLTYTSVAEHSL